MIPIRYNTYRQSIKESIAFYLSSKHYTRSCDMDELLNQLNPVLVIEIVNELAGSARLVVESERELFLHQVSKISYQSLKNQSL